MINIKNDEKEKEVLKVNLKTTPINQKKTENRRNK